MEEETLEQKQKYLRKNVLEKGHDPDKFMEFLNMKKGKDGINLDNWSLQELITVTNEFLLNNKEIEIDLNIEEKDDEKDIENENINEKKNKKNISQDNNIACSLIEQTPITKINKIKIEVTEPKIEKGGIFSFSYSTFIVSTSVLNLKVCRKFTDFIWLYNILKKHFVNCIVPPFIIKKENIDNVKMNKGIYYMEQFLNNIALHPILRNSKFFYDFLAIKDEKDFIRAKNEYGKISAPTNIKLFKTLNAEIKVLFTEDKEEYFKKIQSKLNYQETIYDKLFYHYKILLININQTCQQIKDISNIWKELYNQKNEYFETRSAAGVYDSYNKIMEQMNNLQINNCELIKKSIKRFYKFIKEEYNCFRPLSLIVEKYKINYYKKNQKLLKTKENYYAKLKAENKTDIKDNNNNIDFDELQFNKLMNSDINKLNESKRDYGCYLNIYIDEYERLRDLNDAKLKNNLLGYIKSLTSQFSKFIFNMSEIISFIDTLN